MTCPGCERDVTLVGGYCGHCSSVISRAVGAVLDDEDVEEIVGDVDVYSTSIDDDGFLHVRINVNE